MKIESINANNYKQKTNFGAGKVFTGPLGYYTELMTERSLIDFAVMNSILPLEKLDELMKTRRFIQWDVFGSSKEIEDLRKAVKNIIDTIKSEKPSKEAAKAKEDAKKLFKRIFDSAESPKVSKHLSNEEVEELIEGMDIKNIFG